MSFITGQIIGERETIASLRSLGPNVRQEVGVSVGRLVLRLQVRIKRKLSDDVLSVRTGRLRRSVVTEIENGPTFVLGKAGTNVVYARPHEFGMNETVPVKDHLRTIKQAFGKPIEPREVAVKAHSRKMVFPEKSFLRSSLAEMSPDVNNELNAALARARARI